VINAKWFSESHIVSDWGSAKWTKTHTCSELPIVEEVGAANETEIATCDRSQIASANPLRAGQPLFAPGRAAAFLPCPLSPCRFPSPGIREHNRALAVNTPEARAGNQSTEASRPPPTLASRRKFPYCNAFLPP